MTAGRVWGTENVLPSSNQVSDFGERMWFNGGPKDIFTPYPFVSTASSGKRAFLM